MLMLLLLVCGLGGREIGAQQPMDRSIWYPIRKVYQSAIFQGSAKRHMYFEGWYCKMVSADGKSIYALIPGIAFGKKGTVGHAFIQVINGKTGRTSYHRFPAEEFRYSRKVFSVAIGKNRFGREGIDVGFGEGKDRFQARVKFSEVKPLPGRLVWPGIMGWYRFAPFMETYHGLVSMDHRLEGGGTVGGQRVTFDGGRGYIEKDWGHTFPRSWIWMQSNHFEQEGVSFMCSVARVPWLGKAFQGFLGFLLIEDKVYRFATYTGARLEKLDMQPESVAFVIQSKEFRIEVCARRSKTGELQAPVAGAMDRRIAESVDAILEVKLLDKMGNILYQGEGKNAGLEVVGDTRKLE